MRDNARETQLAEAAVKLEQKRKDRKEEQEKQALARKEKQV